jgi:hypothetical protein
VTTLRIGFYSIYVWFLEVVWLTYLKTFVQLWICLLQLYSANVTTLRIGFYSIYVWFLEVVWLTYIMTFLQLWKLWACGVARDWNVFIDSESGFWGKVVVISVKPQNLQGNRQNGLH